ncbi:MAG: prepilin-type N-terminal cleavage/methylation domain-containing protein [Planctomycetes bacterium]|nr:prepilin-type N-terminal cleavage/methylation domain-containing protein [Planctomycetota bacterium]
MVIPLERRPIRQGYTLLEMLIVVAIIATVVALSWPALRRPLAKSRVRNAAKQLRVALARTRLEAIRSGTAQEFRFEPGTGRFEVSPRSTPEGTGGFTPVALEGFGDDTTSAEALGVEPSHARELPDGVRFSASSPSTGPILFYPNGRTFNARFRLQGQYDYYVDVNLRGLTGSSTMGLIGQFAESGGDMAEPAMEGPL